MRISDWRFVLFALLLLNAAALAQVTQEWVARYNGVAQGDDYAIAVACDQDGSVIVTGFSDGPSSASDYLTIKYSSGGALLWEANYNGPGNGSDGPSALALDGAGNVYVTGFSVGAGGDGDFATIKYSPTGALLWERRYNGPGGGIDQANAIFVDAAGFAYITGLSFGSGTNYDYCTIKYSPSGDELWVQRYNGAANVFDNPLAIAVDAAGNVYVTGSSWGGASTSNDVATVKYSSAGALLWVQRYNGAANGPDSGNDLGIDADGNVYIAATSDGIAGPSTVNDYLVLKYNPAGALLWEQRYDNSGNDFAAHLVLDAAGNAIVTGVSAGAGSGMDWATVKYSSAGAQLWALRYDGAAHSDDGATAICSDPSGNLYVTGYANEGVGNDYLTLKYSPTGVLLWSISYDGLVNEADIPYGIALDADQNVFVSGGSDAEAGSGLAQDFVTIKYSQTGSVVPVTLTDFYAAMSSTGVQLLWQTASEIGCYGWIVQRCQTNSDYSAVSPLIPGYGCSNTPQSYSFIDESTQPGESYKYRLQQFDLDGAAQTFSSVQVTVPHIPSQSCLQQAFPNPFNPTTAIRYQLSTFCLVSLRVFDTAGRLVATLVDERQDAGYYNVVLNGSELPSGIYFCVLQAGNLKTSQKIVLLK